MAKTEDELLAESLAEDRAFYEAEVDKFVAQKTVEMGLTPKEAERLRDLSLQKIAEERAKRPQRLEDVPLPDPAATWPDYECEFQHEILQDTINSVEAICSWQVIAEEKKPNPDQALIKFWELEERRLNRERHNVDPHDEAEIRRLDALYTPVVRYYWKVLPATWKGDPPIWFGPERWMRDHATDGLAPPGFPRPDDPGFKAWALTFQYQIACLTIDFVEWLCSEQFFREKQKPNPDQSLLELWDAEWVRLEAEKCSLDPLDEAAFQKIRESYMPVMIAKDAEGAYWKGDPPIWYGVERWLAEHGTDEGIARPDASKKGA